MRPQLFTAENRYHGTVGGVEIIASMRPQLFTAENCNGLPQQLDDLARFNEAAALHCGKRTLVPRQLDRWRASMRPQLFTAENAGGAGECEARSLASMRPQLFTAENMSAARSRTSNYKCFNEAAALHCGKRGRTRPRQSVRHRASMRPQLFTAENDALALCKGDTGLLQ